MSAKVSFLLSVFLATTGQQPATPSPQSSGAATVSGRITDAQTGEPMPRAVVTVHLQRQDRRLETFSRSDGRYEFTGLPEGPLSVSATAGDQLATHVPGTFMTETPGGGRSSTIVLGEGEVRRDLDIAIARALAISGRVLDDAGQPLAGVLVRALSAPQGEVAGPGRPRETDDRGHFRVFGLSAGRYFVCADLRRGPNIGAQPSGPRSRRPVSACHPSATGDDLGRVVTLANSDVDGIEIQAPRLRTVTISGSVIDANGEPARGQVALSTWSRTGSTGTGWPLNPDGGFMLSDVVPGKYVLSASVGGMSRPDAPDAGRALEYVELDVNLDSEDVSGIVLTTRRGVRVRGRVTFEGAPPSELASRPTVAFEGRVRGMLPVRQAPVQPVSDDFTFEIGNLFGPRTVRVTGLPRGWIVKSVRYRGRDITDLPTEFRIGPDEIEIDLTNRGAVLSGTVMDASDEPATAARVIVLTADAERWPPVAPLGSATVVRDGRFTASPVRAGDYFVMALSAADYARLDGVKPEALARIAERVTLLENDRRSIDLRIVALPEDRRDR